MADASTPPKLFLALTTHEYEYLRALMLLGTAFDASITQGEDGLEAFKQAAPRLRALVDDAERKLGLEACGRLIKRFLDDGDQTFGNLLTWRTKTGAEAGPVDDISERRARRDGILARTIQ